MSKTLNNKLNLLSIARLTLFVIGIIVAIIHLYNNNISNTTQNANAQSKPTCTSKRHI